ncbi:hypothetical protein DH2020_015046 [Rehmannia glutinosa]|uniref:RNA helicase n=1 Tax=Rehmannia glutinosa TaxID=99300 RepID=A0ABR0WZP3_REHGL
MEKDTSFLFSGITFNRKKFASDFARFKEKKEDDDLVETSSLVENGSSAIEEVVRVDKKRKRKAARSDPVEGFSVFTSSKSKAIDELGDHNEDGNLQQKKEYHRQLERDALFRKTHNIHVSGSNIPSPLQDFTELRSRVEFLILDESDKLFELGLVEQVDAVVKACSNPSILRSLFSATLPDTVEELARTIMHDAVRVIIGRKNSASELIKQKLIFVGSEEGKLLALRQSFTESLNPPVLLFVQNKERAKELYNELKYDDIRADVIHADLSQIQREDAIDNFRSGKTWVLIATDVIARGMDFKGVNCVINYDFPDSAAAYIHRIGRSGRAGRSGEAITLYTEADVPFLRNVANVIAASGCEVPEWIMALPKKKWRKHRPQRDSISTKGEEDD